MKARFKMQDVVPDLYKHLVALDKEISSNGIKREILELIKIRTSQLNKCAYCIDVHAKEAIANGGSARRIFALNAWQESNLFSEEEKSVLRLTEEITFIHLQGLTDQTYTELRKHFSTEMIAKLVMACIMMNAWNRSAVSSRKI